MMDDPGLLIRAMSNSARDQPENKSAEAKCVSSEVLSPGEEIPHCTLIRSDHCSRVFIRAADGTTKTARVCRYKCPEHERSLVSVEEWASYVSCRVD